jgi:hypothetical protein
VTVLAQGRTAEGEYWTLETEEHAPGHRPPPGRYLGVQVTSADGSRFWGAGCVLDGPPQAGLLNLTSGSDEAGPCTLSLAVRADVRAVVVLLSDGTREDLQLYPVPGRTDIRAAALVHPRRLDVHRIDLYDAHGDRLPEPDPLG